MWDAAELILGALALVLGGAAFALGGQVIRAAWRDAFRADPSTHAAPAARGGQRAAGATPPARAADASHQAAVAAEHVSGKPASQAVTSTAEQS